MSRFSTVLCLLLLLGMTSPVITTQNNRITSSADSNSTIDQSNIVSFTIFMNNDQHGHIMSADGKGSAAQMITHLKNNGYDPEDRTNMLIAAGDFNTGGPIATLTDGEAMIDVMNVMGFDLAAIGNHEFDISEQVMYDQQAQANFPLLGANIIKVETGEVAEFSTPWVIEERGGVKIGWIGLMTLESNTLRAEWMADNIEITEYEAVVRSNYMEVKAAGADIVFLLTHVTPSDLKNLASDIGDLNIPLIFGGHNEGQQNEVRANSTVIATNHHGVEFAKVTFEIDTNDMSFNNLETIFIENSDNVVGDPEVQMVLDFWDCLVPQEEVIGYASEDIPAGSENMELILANSIIHQMYLQDIPVSIAIFSGGTGIRDQFDGGDVTLGSTINVIPWADKFVILNVSGSFIDSALYSVLSNNYASTPLLEDDGTTKILVDGIWEELNSSKTYSIAVAQFTFFVEQFGVEDALIAQNVEFTFEFSDVRYREALLNYVNVTSDLTDVPEHIFLDGLPSDLKDHAFDWGSFLDTSDRTPCLPDTSATSTSTIVSTTDPVSSPNKTSETTSEIAPFPRGIYLFLVILMVSRIERRMARLR